MRRYSSPHLLGQQLLKTSLDTRGVGATDSLDDLAALVELESGHGGDTVFGGDAGELVDVDLDEADALVLVAQLLEDGRDGLAGTAPGGEVVDDDGALVVCDLGLEGVGAGGKLVQDSGMKKREGTKRVGAGRNQDPTYVSSSVTPILAAD